MCRLLGISVNRPADIRLSSKDFEILSQIHSHGHGFVYEDDGHLVAVKDSTPLYTNPGRADVFGARSRLFIGHLRLASEGSIALQNTHPFVKQQNNVEFAFAHNGTVTRVKTWRISQPCLGQTDSEHAFQWIVDQVRNVHPDDFAAAIQAAGHQIRPLGRFNFLLTDGRTVWAYADDALSLLERRGLYEGRVVALKKARLNVDLHDYKSAEEQAVLVASEPLTNEQWRSLPAGTLVVLRDGHIIEELPPNRVLGTSPAPSRRTYRSLQELESGEKPQSWSKVVRNRASDCVIAAIHGGGIERFTDQIAEAIAGSDQSLYCFLGLRDRSSELHIPSHLFKCRDLSLLQSKARWTLSIHGQRDEIARCIYVGGGNRQRARAFETLLSSSGFDTRTPPPGLAGIDPNNIVNATPDQGVQLEISLGLRRAFFDESGRPTDVFERFIATIRLAIRSLSQAA